MTTMLAYIFSWKTAGTLGAVGMVGALAAHQYRPFSSDALFEQAENKLLQKHITSKFITKDVKITNDRFMHTLIVDEKDDSKPNLVLMHGWSSGLALWCKNIDQLAEHYNVYAVDLLGFGRSGRPYFPRASKATPEQAKSFWVDSFHEWKLNVFGDEKIVLLGHSLGGFLACTYALENGDHVETLLLAAPVGIAPWKISLEGWVRKSVGFLIWTVGVTPQGLLRSFGYFSQRVWNKLGNSANFRGLDADGWDYLYHAQVAPTSGDRAFMSLLTRDGWGYPLFDKMHELKMRVRLIYGANDYVRHEFGPTVVNELTKGDYVVIPGAGHHLYWSHTKKFNDAIIQTKKR